MKVECGNCDKSFDLPDDRLPHGKKVSFPCPGCKSKITLDLREKTEAEPAPPAAKAKEESGKVVYTPIAEKSSDELDGGDLKRKILNSIKDLPPMPKIIQKAREVMANPRSGFKEIAESSKRIRPSPPRCSKYPTPRITDCPVWSRLFIRPRSFWDTRRWSS